MKVISYNLLSPTLCHSDEFLGYQKKNLDIHSRRTKIFRFLDEWVADNPIILLQEVPIEWKGKLELFFYEKNYKFFCMNYGKKYNGYMGVATAIPNNLEVKNVEYYQVGSFLDTQPVESIYEYQKKVEPKLSEHEFVNNVNTFIENNFGIKEDKIKEIEEIINDAKNRPNILIKVLLKEEDKLFNVFNYHLPCSFKKPIIQIMHLDGLKKIASETTNEPVILGGDFNILPDSSGYDYLKLGYLNRSDKIYLVHGGHTSNIFESAMMNVNHRELDFTVHSKTKWGGVFKGTLDYFFLSPKHWKVLEGKKLLDVKERMPNDVSPSDHLPIMIEVQL